MRLQKILLSSLGFVVAATGSAQSVASLNVDPAAFSQGQTSTGIVYLSAPVAVNTTIALSSSQPFFLVPTSVTVLAGNSSAKFPVTMDISADRWGIISATGGGTTRKAYVSPGYNQYVASRRVSLTSTDAQANGHSGETSRAFDGDSRKVSADGRFIVFTSQATNLVASDKNRKSDVFFRDVQLGTTTRVSQLPTGVEANGNSYQPSLSADGNFVAFVSDATNLVPGDANGASDVFLWNRATKEVTLVSRNGQLRSDDTSFQPSISKTGRYVAFATYASTLSTGDTNGWSDVYVYDSTKGTSKRATIGFNPWALEEPNGDCASPSISGDGRYVAFDSFADNLVEKDMNDSQDVFVRDLTAGTTKRVSISPEGTELDGFSFSPSISSTGKVVAFSTYAPLMTDSGAIDVNAKILLRDMAQTKSKVAIQLFYADAIEPSISADGRFVAFATYFPDSNLLGTVGVYDDAFGSGVSLGGNVSWDPSLSANGQFAAFSSSQRGVVTDDTNGKDDVFLSDANGQQPVVITGGGLNGSIPEVLAGDSLTLKLFVKQAPTVALVVPIEVFGAGVSAPSTVTIPAGSLSTSFTVKTTVDSLEHDASVRVVVNSRVLVIGIRVTNASMTVTPAKVSPGGSVTCKIRLAQSSTSTTILNVYTGSGLSAPNIVTMAPGTLTKSFTVKVATDAQPTFTSIQVFGNNISLFGVIQIVN